LKNAYGFIENSSFGLCEYKTLNFPKKLDKFVFSDLDNILENLIKSELIIFGTDAPEYYGFSTSEYEKKIRSLSYGYKSSYVYHREEIDRNLYSTCLRTSGIDFILIKNSENFERGSLRKIISFPSTAILTLAMAGFFDGKVEVGLISVKSISNNQRFIDTEIFIMQTLESRNINYAIL